MRVLASAIAAAVTTDMNSNDLPIPPAKLPDFIAGIIFGLINKDDLPELQHCLQGQEQLEKDVVTAIDDFKKKDFADIIKGVKEIGVVVQEIPQDVKLCTSLSDDISKIENWAKIFQHPLQLAEALVKNLATHWGEVFSDVSKIDTDQKAGNFYNMGDDIADILVLLIGKPSEMEQMESVIDWDYLNSQLKENQIDWDYLNSQLKENMGSMYLF